MQQYAASLLSWGRQKDMPAELLDYLGLPIERPRRNALLWISTRNYVRGCISLRRNILGGGHRRAWVAATRSGFKVIS